MTARIAAKDPLPVGWLIPAPPLSLSLVVLVLLMLILMAAASCPDRPAALSVQSPRTNHPTPRAATAPCAGCSRVGK
jgi:hypothetical protein